MELEMTNPDKIDILSGGTNDGEKTSFKVLAEEGPVIIRVPNEYLKDSGYYGRGIASGFDERAAKEAIANYNKDQYKKLDEAIRKNEEQKTEFAIDYNTDTRFVASEEPKTSNVDDNAVQTTEHTEKPKAESAIDYNADQRFTAPEEPKTESAIDYETDPRFSSPEDPSDETTISYDADANDILPEEQKTESAIDYNTDPRFASPIEESSKPEEPNEEPIKKDSFEIHTQDISKDTLEIDAPIVAPQNDVIIEGVRNDDIRPYGEDPVSRLLTIMNNYLPTVWDALIVKTKNANEVYNLLDRIDEPFKIELLEAIEPVRIASLNTPAVYVKEVSTNAGSEVIQKPSHTIDMSHEGTIKLLIDSQAEWYTAILRQIGIGDNSNEHKALRFISLDNINRESISLLIKAKNAQDSTVTKSFAFFDIKFTSIGNITFGHNTDGNVAVDTSFIYKNFKIFG